MGRDVGNSRDWEIKDQAGSVACQVAGFRTSATSVLFYDNDKLAAYPTPFALFDGEYVNPRSVAEFNESLIGHEQHRGVLQALRLKI